MLQLFNLTQRFVRAHFARSRVVKLQIADGHCSELYLGPVPGITPGRSRLWHARAGESPHSGEMASLLAGRVPSDCICDAWPYLCIIQSLSTDSGDASDGWRT